MSTIIIDLSPESYKRLEEQAQRVGQAVEVLSRELLETALKSHEVARPHTTREVLQAAGRLRPLSDTLRSQIIPGVTLAEVQQFCHTPPVPCSATSFRNNEAGSRDRLLRRRQRFSQTLCG